MSELGERMAQLGIDPQEDTEQMKCYGNSCYDCKRFSECPAYWGSDGESASR
jgi:hypothetical protein